MYGVLSNFTSQLFVVGKHLKRGFVGKHLKRGFVGKHEPLISFLAKLVLFKSNMRNKLWRQCSACGSDGLYVSS